LLRRQNVLDAERERELGAFDLFSIASSLSNWQSGFFVRVFLLDESCSASTSRVLPLEVGEDALGFFHAVRRLFVGRRQVERACVA